jgi:hypothetical protein
MFLYRLFRRQGGFAVHPFLRAVARLLVLLCLAAEARSTTLTLQLSSNAVAVDSPAVVRVAVDQVQSLHAYSITIAYDPLVVRCRKVKLLQYFSLSTFTFSKIDSVNGTVQVDEAVLGNAGHGGAGILFEVTFAGRNTGTTQLSFGTTQLFDTTNSVLPVQTSGAVLQVGSATGVESPGATGDGAAGLEVYPNPFNGQARIGARVSGLGSRIKLAIYDVLGREVAVLVDEFREPGEYQMTFNASRLPSGCYFVRLLAGESTISRRIQLIR